MSSTAFYRNTALLAVLAASSCAVATNDPPIPDGDTAGTSSIGGTSGDGGTGGGIRDVDLLLPGGSFTVVTGRIGAGKTTLLQSVLGLVPARNHNNANILCLPARFVPFELAERITDRFLHESFEGGRHDRRVGKISC